MNAHRSTRETKSNLLVIGLAALLCPAPTAAAPPVFQDQQTYAAGVPPIAITSADFNADGRSDLAVANAVSSVTILIANPDGTFTPAPSLGAASWGYGIAAADLNGDNKIDLAIVNRGAGIVSLYWGNGDGTFQPYWSFAAGKQPYALAVGDLTGNGASDIVIANYSDNEIQVMLGDGFGNFNEASSRTLVGSGPAGLAMADLNRDGWLDVVVAHWAGNNVSILLGKGDGTFQPELSRPAIGTFCMAVAVGDLNHDGIPDIVAANQDLGYASDISILIGNGDGTFQEQVHWGSSVVSNNVVLADLDRGGALDIILAEATKDAATVFRGVGDSSFEPRLDFAVGADPLTVVAADFNGDGWLDLASANYVSQNISVLLQTPQNAPPLPNAGSDVQICSSEQCHTILQGTATDPDSDPLQYRWLEGNTLLSDWTLAENGHCPLNLSVLPVLELGEHLLTLQVKDAYATVPAWMNLTLVNSAPVVLCGESVQARVWRPFSLNASVADFDGDTQSWIWRLGHAIIDQGAIATMPGGVPVELPPVEISTGLGVGEYNFDLSVCDQANPPVSCTTTVQVVDQEGPTLAPVASPSILWPPNRKLVPVQIDTKATDDSGGPLWIAVEQVVSSEPQETDKDGQPIPDWVIVAIHQTEKVIDLALRSARTGKGPGRIYTITISATDLSGNRTTAEVQVQAPHDLGRP